MAAPNPSPTSLFVLLAGPAEGLRVKVYTQGLVRALELELPGAFQQGWNRVDLPAGWSKPLAQGVYFIKAEPLRNGQAGFSVAPVAVYLLD